MQENDINSMLRRRSKDAGIRSVRPRDLHCTQRLRHHSGADHNVFTMPQADDEALPRYRTTVKQPVQFMGIEGARSLECLPEEGLRRLRDRINTILLRRTNIDPEINDCPGSQFGKGLPYPEEVKLLVVEAVRAGTSPTAVSRMYGMGKDTVNRWVRMAREGRSLRPKRPTGSPPVADPEAREWLYSDLEKHPSDTLLSRRHRMWSATSTKPPASFTLWKQIRLWGFVYVEGRWIRPLDGAESANKIKPPG